MLGIVFWIEDLGADREIQAVVEKNKELQRNGFRSVEALVKGSKVSFPRQRADSIEDIEQVKV